LAREYFPAQRVQSRLDELLDAEAEILAALPLRPAVH
jgi:tRNA-(ms[2]io[6]A)-hydroxylase